MNTTLVTHESLVEAIKTRTALTVSEARTIATSFRLLAEYIEDPVDYKGDAVYRLCQALQFSYTQFAKNLTSVMDVGARNKLCSALFRISRAVDKLSESFEDGELSFEEFAAGLTHVQAVLVMLNSNMLVTNEMGGATKAILLGETSAECLKRVEFRARNLYEVTPNDDKRKQ